jgi:hypothetical protein
MVTPLELRRLVKSSTSLAVLESTFPVGSSISKKLGLLAKARAMATRCCCPPLSSLGL